MKRLLAILCLTIFAVGSYAQDNGLNPVFGVFVDEMQYNIKEKKATAGSVIGNVVEALAGRTTTKTNEDRAPGVKAAVKDGVSRVRRLSTVDATGAANAQYVMTGEITVISSSSQNRIVEEKNKDGKVTSTKTYTDYTANVGVSLSLKEVSTGVTRTNTFSGNVSQLDYVETESKALDLAISRLGWNITNFYNNLFPISANIIERGTEKKDKAKEMYIDAGGNAGVFKGQHFTVYIIGSVAGRETRSSVGRLKVESVEGDDIALCKVQKGGKDIKAAFDAGRSLRVVSED